MRKPLPILAVLLLVPGWLCGQTEPPISISRISFDRAGPDGMQVTLDLDVEGNEDPAAKNDDFVDDVQLTLYLCFEMEGEEQYSFYSSSVRMVSLESKNRYSLYFFLPGEVRKRDDLDLVPFAWLTEIEIGGQGVPPRPANFDSQRITSLESYQNFLNMAISGSSENEGILLPHYLASEKLVAQGSISANRLPSFYRFEPEN